MLAQYESVAEVLATRILRLIPRNPQILIMSDPFELFDIGGFYLGDLNPSFAQAQWALSEAIRRYRGS